MIIERVNGMSPFIEVIGHSYSIYPQNYKDFAFIPSLSEGDFSLNFVKYTRER
jgi:hypothetical protein